MSKDRRIFQLDEANALLPQLESMIDALNKIRQKHESLHDRFFMEQLLAQAENKSVPNLDTEAQAVDAAIHEMEDHLSRIRSLGCILRNMEIGWIDFPGKHNGEPVFFCWRRGEQAISFYHLYKGPLTERYPLLQA